MPEDAGCRFGGAIRIDGLLWRTVAFRLKRPAEGCRYIGCVVCRRREQRYFKASPRPGTDMGRENGDPVGNRRNRSDALRNRGACRCRAGRYGRFQSGAVRRRNENSGHGSFRRNRARNFFGFPDFMPDPGLRRSVLPTRKHRSGQTYLLRSGRRLRTVAPACHISLSRISLSSASSFSR